MTAAAIDGGAPIFFSKPSASSRRISVLMMIVRSLRQSSNTAPASPWEAWAAIRTFVSRTIFTK